MDGTRGCTDNCITQIGKHCSYCGLGMALIEDKCVRSCLYSEVNRVGETQICKSCLDGQHYDSGVCWDGTIRNEKFEFQGCQKGYYQYFLDLDGTKACTDGCMTHSDPVTCLKCMAGYFLNGSGLTAAEEAQGTPLPQGVSCKPCKEGCLHCNISRQCTECGKGFYAEKLHSTHASNLVDCKKCDGHCLTCSGPGQNKCTACKNGFFLNKKTGTCDKCLHACEWCTGPEPKDCVSCKLAYYMDRPKNGKFLATRTEKLGEVNVSGSNPEAKQLTLSFKQATSELEFRDWTFFYLKKMQSDYTQRPTGECKSCAKGCAICESGKPDNCHACSHKFWLKRSPLDLNLGDCVACDKTCAECVSSSPEHCTSCPPDFSFIKYSKFQGQYLGICETYKTGGYAMKL
jgi:hypothetical protein